MKKAITMQDIGIGQLFFVQGCGVLRKVDPLVGTDRKNKRRVIYPTEMVSLPHKGKKQ